MNWPLVRRGVLRYSVVAAGGVVAALVAAFGPSVAVGTFVAGLVALFWATAGDGNVRTTTAASNADSMGVTGSVRDAREDTPGALDSDVRVFFFGVGLLVCSPVAVAVAVVLL
ncbi:hypothetical protein [Halobaculum litoreum]|uniref:DUF8070 domain-containing protein n=1 Tax=Halobaculum litoreum TaxID=3031998 RepID=A0ABD5XRK9_9EURY|nr:hypothetical protein [Halobaculum sp. DT92]